MIASAPAVDMQDIHTTAGGAMHRTDRTVTLLAMLVVAPQPESVTTSSYEVPGVFERTVAGPVGQIMPAPTESTEEAILEIRRRSGLTWEEFGDLFDVSRRSVHHWASGKPVVSAGNEKRMRRMLATVRRLDQGSQTATRDRLLTIDDNLGGSPLELLQQGRFDEVEARVDSVPLPRCRPVRLSRAAQDARRPPPPALLLEAEQDRPDIPTKARAVRAARASKKMS